MIKNVDLKIKEPFHSAGKKYGWSGRPAGIGIELKYLSGEGIISVFVENYRRIYSIDKHTAKELYKKYKSRHQKWGKVKAIIPIDSFTSIRKEDESQLNLFNLGITHS